MFVGARSSDDTTSLQRGSAARLSTVEMISDLRVTRVLQYSLVLCVLVPGCTLVRESEKVRGPASVRVLDVTRLGAFAEHPPDLSSVWLAGLRVSRGSAVRK